MRRERSFLKSQWFSFSTKDTGNQYRTETYEEQRHTLGNTPEVLAALDDTAIGRLDILLRTDNGKRYGGQEAACVLGRGLIVLLDRWLVDLDALGLNDSSDLERKAVC